jgi:phospholipase/carboxylesterase
MNRLPELKASHIDITSVPQAPLIDSYPSIASPSRGARLRDRASAPPYSLFAPLHYERGYAYPLLIWLHGDGGSESELRQLMPHVSVRNYIGAAPRGEAKAKGGGYTWQPDEPGIDGAAERVHECIDASKRRFNVHPQRVFIAGNGTMALRLALKFPHWFAGAASLGGAMPTGGRPLGCLKEARRLPLLLAACRDSEDYPPAQVSADLRLLHAGGFSLALRQYPGEHELTTIMLADMDRWLMQQVCPSMASATV